MHRVGGGLQRIQYIQLQNGQFEKVQYWMSKDLYKPWNSNPVLDVRKLSKLLFMSWRLMSMSIVIFLTFSQWLTSSIIEISSFSSTWDLRTWQRPCCRHTHLFSCIFLFLEILTLSLVLGGFGLHVAWCVPDQNQLMCYKVRIILLSLFCDIEEVGNVKFVLKSLTLGTVYRGNSRIAG